MLWCSSPCHGCGEQHAGAERAAEQQLVACLERALGPEAMAGCPLHAEHQLQAKAAGIRGWIAVFQGVPTDQHCLLGIKR